MKQRRRMKKMMEIKIKKEDSLNYNHLNLTIKLSSLNETIRNLIPLLLRVVMMIKTILRMKMVKQNTKRSQSVVMSQKPKSSSKMT
jgi:hypothetical protein